MDKKEPNDFIPKEGMDRFLDEFAKYRQDEFQLELARIAQSVWMEVSQTDFTTKVQITGVFTICTILMETAMMMESLPRDFLLTLFKKQFLFLSQKINDTYIENILKKMDEFTLEPDELETINQGLTTLLNKERMSNKNLRKIKRIQRRILSHLNQKGQGGK